MSTGYVDPEPQHPNSSSSGHLDATVRTSLPDPGYSSDRGPLGDGVGRITACVSDEIPVEVLNLFEDLSIPS